MTVYISVPQTNIYKIDFIYVQVTTIGPNASFTIVFGDFLEATEQAGSVTTMLNSLFNISYSLAGALYSIFS